MIQNTIDFQFFSPIQFNKKFNKKFWDKIQFNKIFNKKILDKIQFKTLFNSKKFNSKIYSISKISRIFNSKFDSKCWNWQDSIQQYIHSIRKRGYRSPLLWTVGAWTTTGSSTAKIKDRGLAKERRVSSQTTSPTSWIATASGWLSCSRITWNYEPIASSGRKQGLSLIHIWRCRRYSLCRSRWSPYH